ncbi:TadE/TadG family type IV pilus assembly protein [Caulobacter sp. KR2-114]|uniref:TadE/TadG family type IV pilus assembly protein n=1 Tax=Caulobacter sp. KR2-114 TaxID=3400912 RepID=UPI003C0E1C67
MTTLRRFLADRGGAAAAELALILGLLTIPLMSVVDLGVYAFERMQVQNAAQMAAQSLWSTCSTTAYWPVTKFCSTGQSNATLGAQQSSLGTDVTVSSIVDGYYCMDTTGTPQAIGSTGTYSTPLTLTKPTSCGSGTWSSTAPAEYVTVTVAYTYKPAFGSVSVGSILNSAMSESSMVPIK